MARTIARKRSKEKREEQGARELKLMNVRDRERGQRRLNNMGTAVTSKILVSMTERCNVRIKRLKHTIVSYFDTHPHKSVLHWHPRYDLDSAA